MPANAFDMVRKIRHLPGLQLTATVDPTKITKRVKNATQRMLRTGVLVGGYSSQSRLLAEQMLDSFHQKAVGSATAWGAFINDASMLDKAGRDQLIELLNASRLIEHANKTNNDRYLNERYDLMIKDVRTHTSGRVLFRAYDKAMNQQIMEAVSKYRAPEQVVAHEALANRLDDPTPFFINIYE